MKVTILPVVTAGVDRGGEDLEFLIEAEVERKKPPNSFMDVDIAFVKEKRCAGYNIEQIITTDHYEFEWRGTASEVLDLPGHKHATIRAMMEDPKNWVFCHSPGEPERLKFSYRHYVDGNAD